MDALLTRPLRLPPNRVYRLYRGGALMDRFRAASKPEDTVFPEDWLGSVTAAINPPAHTYPGEGLSLVEVDGRPVLLADLLAERPEDIAGRDIVARYGPTTALFVKLLDAGSRLPVHVHPTRDQARDIFGSPFFVRPGLLHATGAGVFLVEAQEPTDFSIVAEYQGYPIEPEEAHLGKGWPRMLDIIDHAAVSSDELARLCPAPTRVAGSVREGWHEEDVWGPQSGPYFKAFDLVLDGSLAWPHAGVLRWSS